MYNIQSTKYLHYGGSNVLGYYTTSTGKSVKSQNNTSLTILTLFVFTVAIVNPPQFFVALINLPLMVTVVSTNTAFRQWR
jgi:hypothetical protein